MAEKKFIDVEVREKGLDELNDGLKETEKSVKGTGKSIDDVTGNGGAIAVLDQMTGGLATRFRDMYEASRLFNISLKGTRTALLATGIGAFVVAAGVLVAYWDDIVDLIDGTNRKLERQLTLIQEKGSLLDSQMKVLEAEEKLLEAQGKNTDEIIAKKKTLLQITIGNLGAERAILTAQMEQRKIELAREAGRKAALSFGTGGIVDMGTSYAEINEMKVAANELDASIKSAQASLQGLINGDAPSVEGATTKREKAKGVDGVTGLPIAVIKTNTEIVTDSIVGSAKARAAAVIEQEKRVADAVEYLENRKKDARLSALQASANALLAFGDLVGQTTGAGKALASASALINTFLGITEIIKTPSTLPEPFATIARIANIATVTATGFAAVKNINSVQIPNVGISSGFFRGGGGAATGGGTPATPYIPGFNVIGQGGTNQLERLIAQKERQPVRAYVVSEDVKTQGELDRRIERSATIGRPAIWSKFN